MSEIESVTKEEMMERAKKRQKKGERQTIEDNGSECERGRESERK